MFQPHHISLNGICFLSQFSKVKGSLDLAPTKANDFILITRMSFVRVILTMLVKYLLFQLLKNYEFILFP